MNSNKARFILFYLITLVLSSNTVNNKWFLDKNYIEAYSIYLKGNNCKSSGDSAILYRRSIQKYKFFPEPYFKLAKFYYRNGKYEKTGKMLKKVFKYEQYFKLLREKIEYFKFSIKFFTEQRNYKSVIEYLLKINKLEPKNIYLFKLGKNYFFLHQYINSIKYLRQYLEKQVKDKKESNVVLNSKNNIFAAYEFLIDSYIELNEYTKALRYLKAYYLLNPSPKILKKISILSNNLQYYDKK